MGDLWISLFKTYEAIMIEILNQQAKIKCTLNWVQLERGAR
jgi:hypothetical protein